MKKILVLVLAVVMMAVMSVPAYAELDVVAAEAGIPGFSSLEETKDGYMAGYAIYTELYDDYYVPSYHAYNDALDGLKEKVNNITANNQLAHLYNYVQYLSTAKETFFGDRVTEGKSRYIVPAFRTAMYTAYKADEYQSALNNMNELYKAVAARINFLYVLTDDINGYTLPDPDSGSAGGGAVAAAVSAGNYTITDDNNGTYNYKAYIDITNTSENDISDWNITIDFETNDQIYSFQNNGIGVTMSGNVATIKSYNQYQEWWTIPAGQTLRIDISNANGNANITSINSITFNSADTGTINLGSGVNRIY